MTTDTPLYFDTLMWQAGEEAKAAVRLGLADFVPPLSKSPSARYGVACPTCKATAEQPCRTLKTGRVTDTHKARIEAAR